MTRRVAAPLAVAARRIAARPGSVLLTGFGIALASAALTTLLVGQVVVEDRAVSDAIGRLPADERMLSVSWVGLGTRGWTRLDREARTGFGLSRSGSPCVRSGSGRPGSGRTSFGWRPWTTRRGSSSFGRDDCPRPADRGAVSSSRSTPRAAAGRAGPRRDRVGDGCERGRRSLPSSARPPPPSASSSASASRSWRDGRR